MMCFLTASSMALLWFQRLQGRQCCFIKHILQAFLCESRIIHIFDSLQILLHLFTSLWKTRFLFGLGNFLNSREIISETCLSPNIQERTLWVVMNQQPTFLSHFQMGIERPLRNKLEKHLSGDNLAVLFCHNLVLKYQNVQAYMASYQS